MANGGAGSDTINGGSGSDNIYGGGGDDTIYGGDGNDNVRGDAGNDTLYGGAGNDFIDGGSDADTMYGGDGNDTYLVDDAGDVVIETADGGIDTVRAFINYRLRENVENLTLMGAALNGTGNALNNVIAGTAANNLLDGGDGNDTLQGGAGDDVLIGGAGSDVLTGGAGADRFVVDKADMAAGGLDVIADLDFGGGDRMVFNGFGAAPVEVASYAELVAFLTGSAGGRVVKRDSAGVAQIVIPGANGAEQRINLIDRSGAGTAWAQYQTAAGGGTPTPVNKAPVANADTATVGRSGTVLIDVLANDTDDAAGLTLVSARDLNDDGSVSVVDGKVQVAPAAFASLGAGQTARMQVEYIVRDAGGLTATGLVTITVTGTNDAPVVHSALSAAATEGGAATTLDLLAGATDPNSGTTLAVAGLGTLPGGVTLGADGHTITIDPTSSAFDGLAAGQTRDIVLSFGITDGIATTPQTATITITGTNDAAVIGGVSTGTVKEDTTFTASGTLSVTDVDTGESSFRAASDVAGSYGKLTINAAGAWSYQLNNGSAAVQALNAGQTLTDSIIVRSADGTAKAIDVTIQGTDERMAASTTAYPGTFTPTSISTGSIRFSIMAVDAATGTIYAQTATAVGGQRDLYKVTSSGTTLIQAGFNAGNDMEVVGTAIYGLRSTGELVKYDLATGAMTVDSGTIVSGYSNNGFTQLPDGKLLIVSSFNRYYETNVIKYDPVTHQSTTFASGMELGTGGWGIEYDAASGLVVVSNAQGALFTVTSGGAALFGAAIDTTAQQFTIAPGGAYVYQKSGYGWMRLSTATTSTYNTPEEITVPAYLTGDPNFAKSSDGSGYSLYVAGGNVNVPGGNQVYEFKGFATKSVPLARQPDPIVLDLNGDGVHFAGGMAFDLNADGTAEHLAAMSPADGMLVMDLDRSGRIESGREVLSEVFEGFGYGTAMEALRSLDTDLDGVVDARDARFADLLVWRDADGDGVARADELHTLSSLGIAAISVRETATATAIDGQEVFATGTFTFADGTVHAYAAATLGEAAPAALTGVQALGAGDVVVI